MVNKSVTAKAYLCGAAVASLVSVTALFAYSAIAGPQSPLPRDQQLHNMVFNFAGLSIILWIVGALFSTPFLLVAQAIESRCAASPMTIYGSAGGASGVVGAATFMAIGSAFTGEVETLEAWVLNCSALCSAGVLGGLAFAWSRRLQLRKTGRQDVASAFD